LFPGSIPDQAFLKAVTPPHVALVCDYSLDEMRRVFNRKFSHRIPDYERFLSMLAFSVEIIPTPPEELGESSQDEEKVRDVNDRPIYRAAIAAKAVGIVTGDLDFLESGITHPEMIRAAEFLRMD
jgi:predicted nucleic acid-binding protein